MDLMNFEPIRTHPQLLLDRARSEPDIIAPRHWREGVVHGIIWRTYRDRVREIALGLVDHGVQHGDRVAVMSSARPEWAFAALAMQGVGGVVVGVYPTNSPAEIEQILAHSEAVAFVGETTTELNKVAEIAARTPKLRLVGMDTARRRCLGQSPGQRGRSCAQSERGIQASYPTLWSRWSLPRDSTTPRSLQHVGLHRGSERRHTLAPYASALGPDRRGPLSGTRQP